MKKRSPFSVFVLSLITFGIYDLYWLSKSREELNKQTDFKTPTVWLLVLGSLLLIAAYTFLLAGGHGATYSVSNGVSTSNKTGFLLAALGLVFIAWIALIFISVFWFYKFSKAVNQYTNGKMTTAVSFLILILIHLIGVALIQDSFNEVIDTRNGYGGGPNPPGSPTPKAAPVVGDLVSPQPLKDNQPGVITSPGGKSK